jgi:hypothetical protein
VPELLPDNEIAYLRSRGLRFEAKLEGSMISLVIFGVELPAGYQPQTVDLLLRLPVQFPQVPPDMFWTDPVVTYDGGGVPSATELRETHMGRSWQRWSRHFGMSNWRPGIDDLRSYMTLIRSTLEREVVALAA